MDLGLPTLDSESIEGYIIVAKQYNNDYYPHIKVHTPDELITLPEKTIEYIRERSRRSNEEIQKALNSWIENPSSVDSDWQKRIECTLSEVLFFPSCDDGDWRDCPKCGAISVRCDGRTGCK
jgi:hypothetical protein